MTTSAAVRLGPPSQPLSHDHRLRLCELAEAPDKIDRSALTALAVLLAVQREREDEVGSRRLIRRCGSQLALLRRVLTEARGQHRHEVLRLASQYAQFLGWLHTSVRAKPDAERHHLLANALARQTDDVQMSATMASMHGYIGYQDEDYFTTLAVSETVEPDPRVTPATRALAAQQIARVHATLGRDGSCGRYLDHAEQHLDRALTHPEDEPPWLYYYSSAHLRLQRGRAYHLLRRHTAAVDLLTEALAALAPPLRKAEWTLGYRAILVSSHRRL